jgi:hypothetical protein
MWDGKVGIGPIGRHFELAQRASVNKSRGTLVWKNGSINKQRYTEMVLDLVIPVILEKWPAGELADPHFKIRIQQDHAPAHPKVDDLMTPSCLVRLLSFMMSQTNTTHFSTRCYF